MDNLFKFDRRKSQRHKKDRGALRRALRAVGAPAVYDRVIAPDDWFNYWHQHLDWDGIGDLSPRLRQVFLDGYAQLFRKVALGARRLGKPYQVFIVLFVNNSEQEAVFLHTPNPHSTFPIELREVQWGLPEVVALFAQSLPEFSLLAGHGNGKLYIYAEGHGIPLNQKAET